MRERKLLSVDFRQTGLQPNVRLCFHILQHYNASGRKKETSTGYLVNAYKFYMQPHNERLTEFLKDFHIIRWVAERFHFKSKEDIYHLLNYAEEKEIEDLPPAGRKTFTFFTDNKDDMELYELLSKLKGRQQVYLICLFVQNYIESGQDDYYLEFAGERFLQSLVNSYKRFGDDPDKRVETEEIINIILFISSQTNKPEKTSKDILRLIPDM